MFGQIGVAHVFKEFSLLMFGPEDSSRLLLLCSASRLQLRGDPGGGGATHGDGPAARRGPEWDPGAPPHGVPSRVSLPTSAGVQRGESPDTGNPGKGHAILKWLFSGLEKSLKRI